MGRKFIQFSRFFIYVTHMCEFQRKQNKMCILIIKSKSTYILGTLWTINSGYLFGIWQVSRYIVFCLLIFFYLSLALELLKIVIIIENVFKSSDLTCWKVHLSNLWFGVKYMIELYVLIIYVHLISHIHVEMLSKNIRLTCI